MNDIDRISSYRQYAVVRQKAVAAEDGNEYEVYNWAGQLAEYPEYPDLVDTGARQYAGPMRMPKTIGIEPRVSRVSEPENLKDHSTLYERHQVAARAVLDLWRAYDDIVVLQDDSDPHIEEHTIAEAIIEELIQPSQIPDIVAGAVTKSVYVAMGNEAWNRIRPALLVKAALWEERSETADVFIFPEATVGGVFLSDRQFDIHVGTIASVAGQLRN